MRSTVLLYVALVFSGNLLSQVITTVAGSNTVFPLSVPALQAPLGSVAAVAADSSGNVYAADSANNIVVRIAKDGTLTVIAGNGNPGFSGDGGPATRASLNTPTGVVVAPSGVIYIADEFNQRIRRVGTDGVITTFAGTGAQGFSGDGGPATSASLLYPFLGALDSAGALYIADSNNHRIRKITPDGFISTVAGTGAAGSAGDGGPALQARLNNPTALTIDSTGNILLADTNNHRVRRITPDGTIATIAGNGAAAFSGDGGPAASASLNNPHGLAVDSTGNVYIADLGNQRIRKIAPNGTISTVTGTGVENFTGDGGPARNAALSSPSYVATDSAGTLYIADKNNGRVRRIAADGNIATIAGNGGAFSGDGGKAIGAALNFPFAVVIDSAGNVLIDDSHNNRIRKIARDGSINTIVGDGKQDGGGDGGPAISASLSTPYAIALDATGNLYIADSSDNRIRKVSVAGTIQTIAGTGASGYSGDGGQAAAATLANPRGVAVDSSGNLYIADTFNHVIRQVALNGVIKTIAGTGAEGFSGDGGPATSAKLDSPSNVAVDTVGNVYVLDEANNRVRRIAPDGRIDTVAGNGKPGFSGDGVQATATSLYFPSALQVVGGSLYIADQFNCRIRRVAPNGIIDTVAGTGDCSYFGDGASAASAAVNYPKGLAVDSTGNLYIADTGNNRIRMVLPAGAAISSQITPQSLTFSGIAGGAVPATQSVNLLSGIAGLGFTTTSSAPWLSVTSTSGSIPATVQVTADPGTLAAGSYSANLKVAIPDATPATVTIPVTFTVAAAPAQPALSVNTATLTYSGLQGDVAQTRQLQIVNSGGGTLSFSATASTESGGAWLTVAAGSGTATPSSPASLSVTADFGSLAPGTYRGFVKIAGAGTALTVPVTLSVGSSAAVIVVSQSALTYRVLAQGGIPLPQTFGILNTGQGRMSWTASASTTSGGSWLQVSPANGTVERPYLDVSTVTVSVTPAGLAPGDYFGKIQIAAVATNTPQILTVTLTVLPPGSSLGPEVRPTGLIFTGVAGVNPGSQDALIGNPKGQPDNFLSSSIGRGFAYAPANASIAPSQPGTVRVFPKFTDLAPGDIQRGTITLQFSDGTPVTIRVLSIVAPTSTPSAAAGLERPEPRAPNCDRPGLLLQIRSLQPNFVAVVGQGTTIEVQAADNCGNLIGPGAVGGSAVQAVFSNGDPAVNLTHVGNGVWSGTWRPARQTTGGVIVTITAFSVQGTSTKSNQLDIAGTISSGNTPVVTAGGVVHGASFAAGVPIAPGSLITIYGDNLASQTALPSTLPLPDQLGGAELRLGDDPLPLLFASPKQLNVQVPFDLPVNAQFQVTVQRDGVLSVPEQLVIAAAQPGIFTRDFSGSGQGLILKSDLTTFAAPGTPASAGDTVVIYCTGLGAVTPEVLAGTPAPASPLSRVVNPVSVSIGGIAAAVSFAGLSPGSTGLYQVNVVVPQGVAAGDSVPVTLQVAGQASPPVTMAIQ